MKRKKNLRTSDVQILHNVLHERNAAPDPNMYRLHIISNSVLSRNSARRLSDLDGVTNPRVGRYARREVERPPYQAHSAWSLTIIGDYDKKVIILGVEFAEFHLEFQEFYGGPLSLHFYRNSTTSPPNMQRT